MPVIYGSKLGNSAPGNKSHLIYRYSRIFKKNTKFTSEKLSALLNTNTSNFQTTKKISIRISISLNKIFRNFYLNLKLNKVLHRRRLREQHAGMKNSVSNGLANFGNFPHLGGYPFAHHWAAKHAAASPAEYNLSFGLAKYQFWLHNFLDFCELSTPD